MAELSSQPTSIQSLYGWYADDKLFVNRRYQRKLVWTLEEKQKLVESILRKYPIPAILLAEKADSPGGFEIIDGLQRLHAIISFIETSFATEQVKHFDLTHFPTAKTRADEKKFEPARPTKLLTAKEVTTMLDYSLAISIMRNATEVEINDVFGRINTYGHRLSDQERRQAGVQTDFSAMVRNLACNIRGDASAEILLLKSMPSSEQCIADIAVCAVQGVLIERSKDALDEIYDGNNPAARKLADALDAYGANKFEDEFKYCVDELLKVCNYSAPEKLRDIIFSKRTTNAFPSVFAVIILAMHELIVSDKKAISDYGGVKKALHNIVDRIETGRKATAAEERRKNIDTIKGLISPHFIAKKPPPTIYGTHSATDIEAIVRRSEVELSDYELKQGFLTLDSRQWDTKLVERVITAICAIANNGPNRSGKLIIGVTDKVEDAQRIEGLDGIKPKKVGRRYIVGVAREASIMKVSVEQYVAKLKQAIKNSALSGGLKASVLSHIDFNSFYGLGVIVVSIPPQKEPSYVADSMYWRDGDSTQIAGTNKMVGDIARRF